MIQTHLERLFFVVYIPNMSLKIGADGKGSLAIFTFVRLLSSMGSQMSSQVGRSGEHFAAKSASIFLFAS